MAQAATMGPPLSPRETRRSGRRSAPSTSTSTSKSPDSDQPPRQKDTSSRSGMSSNSSNGRNRRPKQEDFDDIVDEHNPASAPSVASNASTNGKGKRKGKEKDKRPPQEEMVDDTLPPHDDNDPQDGDEEEEQGITRCVCGSAEDDPDAGEFMVQCEGCKVWQHGLCMGYQSEDQVHDDDYYCEQCKPELHTELLRRLSQKKGRHGQVPSHQNNNAATRVSRSHSPGLTAKQPSRRRNTMNSRDADFAENLKEIIEATAAEAAAAKDSGVPPPDEEAIPINGETESQANGKKKRKRADEEIHVKKRTRSASTASDRPASAIPREETPLSTATNKGASQAPAPAKGGQKGKRGGRKAAATEPVVTVEGEEAVIPPSTTNTTTTTTTSGKRGGNRKGANAKRPPLSHATSHNSAGAHQEQGRRTAANNVNAQHNNSGPADSRAYRNTHAYVVSQQPLLTSWGLPDYLAHLEHILPSNTPQPLEVPAGPSSATTGLRGDSADRNMERGVKVKWPSKRMSVGDMNKRVRALVEWVGREQASATDRERRREALENELKQPTRNVDDEDAMMVDRSEAMDGHDPLSTIKPFDKEASASTMKQMEELMEELIVFQERFGPGAKARDRERRHPILAS